MTGTGVAPGIHKIAEAFLDTSDTINCPFCRY